MEPAANGTQTEPLGKGWTIATTAIGIFAALIGLGGMILSFRAVSAEMIPAFGTHWAWLVPLVIDLTVFAFSGVDLVLTRHGMSHPLARFTVYAATVGTVWLNYDAGGNTPGRVAHVLMPLIWVLFIEILRHVVRRKAHLAGAEIREPIPAARWLLSPVPTALLYRRMVLWQTNSYRAALAHERERLRATAALREKHGRLWRLHVAPIVRLELSLGPSATGLVQPSTLTVQQSAEDERPAVGETSTTPSTQVTVQRPTGSSSDRPRRPSTGRPKPSTPSPSTGQPDMDEWVRIGHPVYLTVRDSVGKRPPESDFQSALAAKAAELIAAGELAACYGDPSLSTAKRVRKEIETRFPDLSPLHLIREAS